jgi:hypothetical protein
VTLQPVSGPSEAFLEFHKNIENARNLVMGGKRLEQLKVDAFDVGDIYRAAWTQAVAALDHWVYEELIHRAVALIQQPGSPRTEKFNKLTISVEFFEDVHHHGKPLDEAFRTQLEKTFGLVTFQRPDAIQSAFAHLRSGKLWPKVAKVLTAQRTDGSTITVHKVTSTLNAIVQRRNEIAHESDRDPASATGRRPISEAEVTEAINWLEVIAAAILVILDEDP